MTAFKLIKRASAPNGHLYQKTVTVPRRLSFDEDRAITEFRGFHAVATIYAGRVMTPNVIQTMREILADIDGALAAQQK